MIPYAGYDGWRAPAWLPAKPLPSPGYAVPHDAIRAYNLFQTGKDTLEIASAMGVSEAVALRWVSDARSAFRGLASPYPKVGV